jgi:hypothetical protein
MNKVKVNFHFKKLWRKSLHILLNEVKNVGMEVTYISRNVDVLIGEIDSSKIPSLAKITGKKELQVYPRGKDERKET